MAKKRILLVICMAFILCVFSGNAFAWTATGTVAKITQDANGPRILVDIGGGDLKGGYVSSGTDENAVLAVALTAQAGGYTNVKLTILSGEITAIEIIQ